MVLTVSYEEELSCIISHSIEATHQSRRIISQVKSCENVRIERVGKGERESGRELFDLLECLFCPQYEHTQ